MGMDNAQLFPTVLKRCQKMVLYQSVVGVYDNLLVGGSMEMLQYAPKRPQVKVSDSVKKPEVLKIEVLDSGPCPEKTDSPNEIFSDVPIQDRAAEEIPSPELEKSDSNISISAGAIVEALQHSEKKEQVNMVLTESAMMDLLKVFASTVLPEIVEKHFFKFNQPSFVSGADSAVFPPSKGEEQDNTVLMENTMEDNKVFLAGTGLPEVIEKVNNASSSFRSQEPEDPEDVQDVADLAGGPTAVHLEDKEAKYPEMGEGHDVPHALPCDPPNYCDREFFLCSKGQEEEFFLCGPAADPISVCQAEKFEFFYCENPSEVLGSAFFDFDFDLKGKAPLSANFLILLILFLSLFRIPADWGTGDFNAGSMCMEGISWMRDTLYLFEKFGGYLRFKW